MPTKTLKIDLEAYETLARLKRPGQSFSGVIREHLDRRKTGADLLRAVKGIRLEAATLDAIEEMIRQRR